MKNLENVENIGCAQKSLSFRNEDVHSMAQRQAQIVRENFCLCLLEVKILAVAPGSEAIDVFSTIRHSLYRSIGHTKSVIF